MENAKKFAYLGESFSRFIMLISIATIVFIIEKTINYRFVVVQKAVQGGAVSENWQAYMLLSLVTILVAIILRVIKVLFMMWVEKTLKVNFFKVYNGVIQEEGKLQASLKNLTVACSKVHCVIGAIETIINSIYIVLLMGIVSMSVPQYIGAVAILGAGICLGVVRGRLQAKTDLLGSETQALQQKISNFFMPSERILNERLKEIESNYWRRIILQCVKNAIQVMPDLIKIMAFVGMFYDITSTGMAEGEIYPYTYVVLSAYGYVVALADNISNLLEYVFKIVLYKQDFELQEVQEDMKKREEEIAQNADTVNLDDRNLVVRINFTAGLSRPNGETASYKVPQPLCLPKGEMVVLDGENGTGKSRFCKLLKELVPGTIAYDRKTTIVEKYHENFKRGKAKIDFELIRYLGEGLGLERIPKSKKEFMELNCSRLNGADMQMLIALQILYFAIKDKASLVILDELLANLSLDRAQKVLPFMANELAKIGACTIVVTHSHKEEVKKYASYMWMMYNEASNVLITSKKL